MCLTAYINQSIITGMGTLKFVNLDYPDAVVYKESVILFGICILESIRIHLGQKGSLLDNGWRWFSLIFYVLVKFWYLPGYHVWLSVILAVPVALGVVHLLFLQLFVLKLEYILCALMLVLLITEIIFAIIFLFSLCKQPTYEWWWLHRGPPKAFS